MGVYADQSGLPSTQLGKTSSTVINSTVGWQTVSLASPVTVKAGQTVWLSWVFQNNPGIRYSVGKPGRTQSSGTWSAGMPSTFGASGLGDYNYSVYCTFEAGTVTTKSGIIVNEDEGNIIAEEQNSFQTTNMSDLIDNLKIEMYPNPADSKVSIRFSALPEEGAKISIFDRTGREVKSQVVQNTIETLDIQELKQGMYLVKTEMRNNSQTHKLIKK
jgi:hypothetical protein